MIAEPGQVLFIRQKLLRWGRSNYRNFPWRSCKNKWHCLVTEIMLQRTRAEQVVPVFVEFTEKYKKPQDYLDDIGANTFVKLGLPDRDRQFRLLNRVIAEKGIPSNKEELLRLPGIGEYIASAYLSFHLSMRSSIIDSNTVRVYGRFFGFDTDPETRRKRWLKELADAITPRIKFRDYNYGLIDFSRGVCTVKPHCNECPVRRRCDRGLSYSAGKTS